MRAIAEDLRIEVGGGNVVNAVDCEAKYYLFTMIRSPSLQKRYVGLRVLQRSSKYWIIPRRTASMNRGRIGCLWRNADLSRYSRGYTKVAAARVSGHVLSDTK